MDSDEFITQEKARELVALLGQARALLRDSSIVDEGHGTWTVDRDAWLDKVAKQLH